MKKICIILGFSLSILATGASADALKNSLTNMLNEKDTSSSMVNLSQINLNGKPKPVRQKIKTRSSKAVVATVNGHKVIKKEADTYLKERTQGKVSNFDALPKKQRLRLIQEISLPIVILDNAQKELSDEEKESIYVRLWMKKEALKINITDEQIKGVYDNLKQKSEENNSTTDIPTFESVKDRMKSQMMEKEMIGKLMKDVEIKIEENN